MASSMRVWNTAKNAVRKPFLCSLFCQLIHRQGCGNIISAPGVPAASGCSKLCTGNATEYCGGSSRLNVYQLGTVDTSISSSSISSTSSSTSSLAASTSSASSSSVSSSSTSDSSISFSSTSSSSTSSTSATATGLPDGWSYRGCHIDNVYGKILIKPQPNNPQLTIETCVAACVAGGYSIAGVEYGVGMWTVPPLRFHYTS